MSRREPSTNFDAARDPMHTRGRRRTAVAAARALVVATIVATISAGTPSFDLSTGPAASLRAIAPGPASAVSEPGPVSSNVPDTATPATTAASGATLGAVTAVRSMATTDPGASPQEAEPTPSANSTLRLAIPAPLQTRSGGSGSMPAVEQVGSPTPPGMPTPIASHAFPAQPFGPPTPTPVRGVVPGIPVPASIDATGVADASAALIAFLATVPDGSTIVFKAGGVYRMDVGFKVSKRHNLVFEGNGATLRSNGGSAIANSLFALWSSTGISIRNFNLVGNSPTPGVYQSGAEWAHGVMVDAGGTVDVYNVTISAVWGDCLLVAHWTDTVRFHNSTCKSAGRGGAVVTAGKNVLVERSSFAKIGYAVFNIEPNNSTQGATNIKYLNNTVGTYGTIFFSANGAAGSVVSDVTVSGNQVGGSTLASNVTRARRSRIVFTNNSSSILSSRPVAIFSHVDGLTLTGNVEPLKSGPLFTVTDCTGVVQ